MRKLTVLVFAIAVAMVVAVAACGSEDPTATPRVSQPTAVPVVEAPTVMAEEPMVETPMAEEPMVETPMAEEPMVETPMAEEPMVEIETIVFSDLNWASAQLQNRIAQYVTEVGYGYETGVLFGATLPLLQGLRRGDTHITMEIWLPNQLESWTEAVEAGDVQQIGHSLGADWQSSFVIPRYLQEQYPGLDSIEDLKDPQYKELFDTPETGGKARLVSCVIGWACEAVNDAQIAAYGLSDHVHIVNPGDSAAANADLYGAYEREEPWLGYQWGTNEPALTLDLVRLEEPPFTAECWAADKGCAYQDAQIYIGIRTELIEGAPEIVDFLRNWSFDIVQYSAVITWQLENPNADTNDSALYWLTNNEDEWSTWVTDDAAVAIRAALTAGDRPDGWPTE